MLRQWVLTILPSLERMLSSRFSHSKLSPRESDRFAREGIRVAMQVASMSSSGGYRGNSRSCSMLYPRHRNSFLRRSDIIERRLRA